MHGASGFQHSDKTAKNTKEFVEKHRSIEKLPLVGFLEDVDFHPCSIHIHKPDNTLCIVNHAFEKGGERIKVFDIVTAETAEDENDYNAVPSKLIYKHSIASEWMKNEMNGVLNSLVVVEPNKFCVTQHEAHAQDRSLSDAQTDIKALKLLYFKPKATNVWCCEYSSSLECKKFADRFVMANGITHNADHSKIFVADCLERSISVFDRDSSTNNLSNEVTVRFPHPIIDNVKFDDVTGNVCGAGYTNLCLSLKNFALCHGEEKEESTSSLVKLSCIINHKRKHLKDHTGWMVKSLLSTNKLNMATNGMRVKCHGIWNWL